MRRLLARPATTAPGGVSRDERPTGGPVPLAARLRAARALVAALEQEQRHELLVVIHLTIPASTVFSAADLFAHRTISPALAAALADAGIGSVRQLGKRLRTLEGLGLERVCRDERGIVWAVSASALT